MKIAKRKYPLLSQLISCYRGQKISKKKKKKTRERETWYWRDLVFLQLKQKSLNKFKKAFTKSSPIWRQTLFSFEDEPQATVTVRKILRV